MAQWLERLHEIWKVLGSNPAPVSSFGYNNTLGSGGVKMCATDPLIPHYYSALIP